MLHALMRVFGELGLTAIRPHLCSSSVSVTDENPFCL